MHQPEISIIGSGHVATNLAHALRQAGFQINEIYSRKIANAEKLSQQIPRSKPTDHLDFSFSASHLFIISISDNAIASVVKTAIFPPACVVAHTSGTADLAVLSPLKSDCKIAIFYPLQTFIKSQVIGFDDVPIVLEANDEKVLTQLKSITEKIEGKAIELNSDQKQSLHVAAVFASNFSNRMLAGAEKIMNKNELDMGLLLPLIFQSINNALDIGADEALTGPAKRKDETTIDKHLELLKQYPDLEKVYRLLSDQIIKK